MFIQIRDGGGDPLSRILNFENLSFETCMPGGPTVASFVLHRKVNIEWDDLKAFNYVLIGEAGFVFFEGYIDLVNRGVSPDAFDIQCLGWSARLNQCGTTADITVVGGANDQAHDFINNVMFIDTDITDFMSAGEITITDHAYQATARFEFAPYTCYFDCLEQFNQTDNWDFGCEHDIDSNKPKFYWRPKEEVVDWVVSTNDCDSITISPNAASLCNYVYVTYTQTGSINQTVTAEDTDSQATYGRTIYKHLDVPGTTLTVDAQAIADLYIEDHSELKVIAEFTCKRVFDIYGVEHHLGEVRAGDTVRVSDWNPIEELLEADCITDISTFRIKATTYSHDDYSLQVTPTEFVSQIEVTLARIEAEAY